MGALDEDIFNNKKFSSLFEEIYNNHKKRDNQISILINELKPLVKESGDAALLVPLIASYLDLGIKNDDHLIKMATVIQRIFNNANNGDKGDELGLSKEEREQLEKELKEISLNKK